MVFIDRILLVEAQTLHYNTGYPWEIMPPLGLLSLAAYLRRERGDMQIEIFDPRLEAAPLDGLKRKLSDFDPHIVGFRGVSREGNYMDELARMTKEHLPSCTIIAGGPHVTALREKILENEAVDAGVFGEGELTIVDLVDRLRAGDSLQGCAGVVYRDGSGVATANPPREFIADLNLLPYPAWELVNCQTYFQMNDVPMMLNAHPRMMHMLTSRGCPFRCAYCHNIFGKGYRAQAPERVLGEMETLYYLYGVRQYDFWDDIFNLQKDRVRGICDLIVKRGLNLRMTFNNGLRGDIIDEPLVETMMGAGTYFITYAVETASPRLQKLIGKHIQLDKLKKIIRYTSQLGIITRAYFMLGFPTETRDEILATIRFAVESELDIAVFFVVNPFEGTEIAAIARRAGIDLAQVKDKYEYQAANFSLCEVPRDELQQIYVKAHEDFFTPDRLERVRTKFARFKL